MSNLKSIIANRPTLFTDAISTQAIPAGHILMNAPRPLLGTAVEFNLCLHGRFYVLLPTEDSISETFAAENARLDAYIIIPTNREHLMEMALRDCRYETQYREMDEATRWDYLRGATASLQGLPYSEAVDLLAFASSKLVPPPAAK